MIVKYGKPVDMRKINRNLNGIKKAIEFSHMAADKYYKPYNLDSILTCRICNASIVTRKTGGHAPVRHSLRFGINMNIINAKNVELSFWQIYRI